MAAGSAVAGPATTVSGADNATAGAPEAPVVDARRRRDAAVTAAGMSPRPFAARAATADTGRIRVLAGRYSRSYDRRR